MLKAYLGYLLGDGQKLLAQLGYAPLPANIDQQVHTVKFGINYRFGWGKAPTPVVARY